MKKNRFQNQEKFDNLVFGTLSLCAEIPGKREIQTIKSQLVRSAGELGAKHLAIKDQPGAVYYEQLRQLDKDCIKAIYWLDLLSKEYEHFHPAFIFLRMEFDTVMEEVIRRNQNSNSTRNRQ